jgi:hypothetical protein
MNRWYFVLVTYALVAQPRPIQPGQGRWDIKTSLAETADLAHPRDVTIDSLIELKEPLTGMSTYQHQRFPQAAGAFREGEILNVQGWLHLVAFEVDGDYHMQISASPESGDNCVIVKIPYPGFVQSKPLALLVRQARDIVRQRALKGQEPSPGGSVLTHPMRVQVVGALFFDDQHVGLRPRGKKGMKSATSWELVCPVAFVDI